MYKTAISRACNLSLLRRALPPPRKFRFLSPMLSFAEGSRSEDGPEKQVANVIHSRQRVASCSKAAKRFHVAFMGNKW